MADSEIEALKRTVGVQTDQDLAAYLGVERSAVAQWKRRGLPAKYGFLLRPRTTAEIRDAVRSANRHHVFGRADHHYWLAAALAVLPPDMLAAREEASGARGARLERLLIAVMGVAMTVTLTDLRKRRCENDADYAALVEALKTRHADRLADLIARQE